MGTAVVMALGLFLMPVPSAVATGQQTTVDYVFERPQIREVVIEGDSFHRIDMGHAPISGNVGQPALPARAARGRPNPESVLPAG